MTSAVHTPLTPDTTQAVATEVEFVQQCVTEILDAVGDHLQDADLRFIAQELPMALDALTELLRAAGARIGEVNPPLIVAA